MLVYRLHRAKICTGVWHNWIKGERNRRGTGR